MTGSIPASEKKGISGSALKIIAIVTMLLDHIGAALLQQPLANAAFAAGAAVWEPGILIKACPSLAIPYYILRYTGRIAFPIFCFLLVEGFLHTKNLPKYCARLAVFSLISELPFDLAFYRTPVYTRSQNVFFTLLIGLLVIAFHHYCTTHLSGSSGYILPALGLIAGMLLAEALHTDYGYVGVIAISLFYWLRKSRMLSAAASCFSLLLSAPLEITAFFAVPLIHLYNGKRGLSLKYVFYAFYPAHLLILYLIQQHI